MISKCSQDALIVEFLRVQAAYKKQQEDVKYWQDKLVEAIQKLETAHQNYEAMKQDLTDFGMQDALNRLMLMDSEENKI